MSKQVQVQVLHFPTLKTVLAVEDVIKNAELAVSKSEILRLLPTKTMRSTLNFTLDYMEKRGLILDVGKKKTSAYIWTYDPHFNPADGKYVDGSEIIQRITKLIGPEPLKNRRSTSSSHDSKGNHPV